eukprot:Hpha_TRINITY_DN1202_c0_g1::TRINITY_DN1202_c0_g1_i1::g.44841::m.44841
MALQGHAALSLRRSSGHGPGGGRRGSLTRRKQGTTPPPGRSLASGAPPGLRSAESSGHGLACGCGAADLWLTDAARSWIRAAGMRCVRPSAFGFRGAPGAVSSRSQTPVNVPGTPFFIGDYLDACRPAVLAEKGIALVINLAPDMASTGVKLYRGTGIEYAEVRGFPDTCTSDISGAVAAAEAALAGLQGRGGVLLHCHRGISRAPTITCALLLRRGKKLRDVVELVARARPVAAPNAGFLAQLVTISTGGTDDPNSDVDST